MEKDEEIKNRIRRILVRLRKEHELTQTDVGKIVGKGKTAVASWEQGISIPDIVTLYTLAQYYHKPISYMFGEGDDES